MTHADPELSPRADVAAVIQAAGLGERLGRGPKAFLSLGGRTLLERAVAAMRPVAATVLAAVPAEHVASARRLCAPGASVIAGGPTRAETLAVLLARVEEPWVLLHDVVHPFVTPSLARRVIDAARARGAAVAAVRSTSTGYLAPAGRVEGRVAPGDLWLTSKPWAFRRDAFARGLAALGGIPEGIGGVLRRAEQEVVLVAAEPWNFKLTTADDWRMAEVIERGGPPRA